MTETVPGLERGLKMLTEFSAREPVLGAPELTKRLGIPRSTVFRLLQTLESLRFVERVDKDRNFSLGPAVLQLGYGFLASMEIARTGQPVIESLRDVTGLACHVVIRDGRDIVVVARAKSQLPLLRSVRINVGTRLPAHAATHGFALMADLTLGELRSLYPEPTLRRFTSLTPGTVEELHARALEDSKRGYSIGESSFESGISVVSAPIRDATGRLVAVATATVAASKVDMALLEDGLVWKVKDAANEISRRLSRSTQATSKYLEQAELQ
ncbi:IclR family transcriptional regulator [Caballeronia novacaledonica]|uniref:IclR family transcriptional regulator n=1 Tax=Caballeronia novacaledonica TaxID=1544861 RepID=A0AA37IKS0_9BURK|nr:IclR family transcriptional regulator [Caballeronia novacaledonica]GJH31054.1 IclR family transcriptional regulator [Caballeronia novacaledonica]